MSRTISSNASSAAFAGDTTQEFIVLLTINHASFLTPLNFNNSGADVTSNAVLYSAFPFTVNLPDDQEGIPTRAQLTIDNTDRTIISAIRSLGSPAIITLQIVMASAPDTVEALFPSFLLRNVNFDRTQVTGDLMLDEYTTEPYPGDTFTLANFPGLF